MFQMKNTVRWICARRNICSIQSIWHENTPYKHVKIPIYTQGKLLSSISSKSGQTSDINLYRDIYKEVGYKSPFTSEEDLIILNELNSAKSVEQLIEVCGKLKATSVFEHIQKFGAFQCVEELLSVKKFDEKVVARLGKKIIKLVDQKINPPSNVTPQSDEKDVSLFHLENKNVSKMRGKISRSLKPKIKVQEYNSGMIQSIAVLKLSFYNISYTHVEKNTKKVLSWDSFSCFEKKDSAQHPKLHENIIRIVAQIPHADLYLIEEQLPIIPNRDISNLLNKVNVKQLQTALISLLNIRTFQTNIHKTNILEESENSESVNNCVHLINANVIYDLFDLRVGTERIGIYDRIFQGDSSLLKTDSCFYGTGINDNDYEIRNIDKYAKEHLSSTLMIAVGFKELMNTSSN